MATVGGVTNEKIFSVKGWGGLNESPDGDTRLKLGEASKMVNWKVTRDGNLKRRPGTAFVAGLCDEYAIHVNGNIKMLSPVEPSDTVQIYREVSADYVPGRATPVGESSGVVDGTLIVSNATIRNGVLSFSENSGVHVEDGTLVIENAPEVMTIAQLREELDDLLDDEALYMYYDELVYALNENSLYTDNGILYLGGYEVTSVPIAVSDEARVWGLWSGLVQGKEMLLAACNGKVWSLYNADEDRMIRLPVGDLITDSPVTFFPFSGDVYIMNGHDYYVFDGSLFRSVPGYSPLIAIAIGPVINAQGDSNSGETTGEYINRLTSYRRVWLSPDGEHDVFPLPEQNITWTDACYVKDLGTGEELDASLYTIDTVNGQVAFHLIEHDSETDTDVPVHPARAVNSYEVCYSMPTEIDYRSQVTGNHFAELFSGPTDNMVFIYGDGTNRALYSGMDYDGMPRADYFPDQYEVHVGDSNTPLTAMIRHYGDLVCYKTDSAWAITQSSMELASGDNTIAIYCTPVNRDKGNVAPGQVRLVENNPVTCSERELYQWINSSYYTSTLSRDERQARRISDRIQSSIKEIDLPECCMWDDNDGQEFYISDNKVTLVWNYAADAWYRYEGIDAACMCNFQGEVIYGTSDGLIARLTYDSLGDMGYPVKAEWVSGAIDFGAANMRKYSSSMWIGLKPETGTSVDVKLITDRKDTFKDKIVSSEKAKVAGQPFVVKTKLKAKKFVFYRLLLSVMDKQPAVTVTDVEFRVRQTGYTK